jgi:putative heme-binding domain-containing protein
MPITAPLPLPPFRALRATMSGLVTATALCALLAAAWLRPAAAAAEELALHDGDRVVLIGDTLFEREGSAAALELRLHLHAAPLAITVRNLAYSADRPDGVSRASFDPPAAGLARLREQIIQAKPTVAIIGYGMAAALEELGWRSHDPALGLDAARYGEDFTAARFRKDLDALLETVAGSGGGSAVRIVLVTPIAPEDLRAQRPALPDPAALRAILAPYREAIISLGAERKARVIDTPALIPAGTLITDNGIHPSLAGLELWADALAGALGWDTPGARTFSAAERTALRATLRRKNELFFHRWRPANQTYLFGFRKNEQGKNAAEMGQFDTLVAQADTLIAALLRGAEAPALPATQAPPPAPTAVAAPAFTTDKGLAVSLWANNPLLSKPVGMAWDAHGRMWVTSTPLYPQIEPGAVSSDRVFVLEDTDHSGHASKSTLFADDLLLPTGIAPVERLDGRAQAYVGASTELLLLTASGSELHADQRRIVLSGFGTEDTHHIIHTLRWGPDGRLYLQQGVYAHSHVETPWGVVRLNAGGVLAYDPRSERLEVAVKGLWNSWGLRFDDHGQMFLTDGAGSSGLSWAFPGAVFSPSEGARATMPSSSSGSYPKFCGLELIRSPCFPPEWQGQAITCDFRAHRVVRFAITDRGQGEPPRSGYATTDKPDVMRSDSAFFRPISLAIGPDGGLFIADWTNQVINHGEVDFRDPRRDKLHGRVWRLAGEGLPAAVWADLTTLGVPALSTALLSSNVWEREGARRVLAARAEADPAVVTAVQSWGGSALAAGSAYAAAAVLCSAGRRDLALALLRPESPAERMISARWMGQSIHPEQHLQRLTELAQDASPRVRVEALRALARIPTLAAAEAALPAVARQAEDDPQYAFAVSTTMATLGGRWAAAVAAGSWPAAGREDQLVAGLLALPVESSGPATAAVLHAQATLERAPWPALVAHGGDVDAVSRLFAGLPGTLSDAELCAALDACAGAAARGVLPSGDTSALGTLVQHRAPEVRRSALRLVGKWKRIELVDQLRAAASDPALRADAIGGIQALGGEVAVRQFSLLLEGAADPMTKREALGGLARVDAAAALTRAWVLLAGADEAEAGAVWRAILPAAGLIERVMAKDGLPATLPRAALQGGLTAARELGNRGKNLVLRFTSALGAAPAPAPAGAEVAPADLDGWVVLTKAKGDPVAGERLYFSAALSCVQCHAIGGVGGKLGPDLTTIGASAPLDYIVESVLLPAAKIKEGYHAVGYHLKDGSIVVGIPFAEDDRSWRIRMPGAEQTILKAEVTKRDTLGTLMPPGLVDLLPVAERANVFAFLGMLGRPGAWDASDGRVARVWRLASDRAELAAGGPLEAKPAVYTLVDGRALAGHWRTALSALPGNGTVYAAARFETAAAGALALTVTGTEAVWLDGVAWKPGTGRELPAGAHLVVLGLERGALPKELRVSIGSGRFTTP